MTILFMGGEMGAFIPSDGNATERTFGSSYQTAFSRCALGPRGSISYCESASFAAQDEVWVHLCLTDGQGLTGGTNIEALTLTNAAGTNLFRINWNNSANQLSMQYWNGSAYVTAGSAFSIDVAQSPQHLDLHVDGNSATGSCALYVSGTKRAEAPSVDLSTVTAITKVRTYGYASIGDTATSQVVVSTTSTIGGRLFTAPVTGVGASTDWTGTYTSVDEVAYDDTDFINSDTANEVSTFTVNSPTLTGYQVQAVAVTARAKKGSSGPANLQLALRSAGTNYFSSSKALDAGYGAFVHIWETDPATAAAWINTAISSLQPGVKSIT